MSEATRVAAHLRPRLGCRRGLQLDYHPAHLDIHTVANPSWRRLVYWPSLKVPVRLRFRIMLWPSSVLMLGLIDDTGMAQPGDAYDRASFAAYLQGGTSAADYSYGTCQHRLQVFLPAFRPLTWCFTLDAQARVARVSLPSLRAAWQPNALLEGSEFYPFLALAAGSVRVSALSTHTETGAYHDFASKFHLE